MDRQRRALRFVSALGHMRLQKAQRRFLIAVICQHRFADAQADRQYDDVVALWVPIRKGRAMSAWRPAIRQARHVRMRLEQAAAGAAETHTTPMWLCTIRVHRAFMQMTDTSCHAAICVTN
nr:hypothetical protein [Xanthomonas arboricola]